MRIKWAPCRHLSFTAVAGFLATAAFGQPPAGGDRFEPPVPIHVNGRVLEFRDWLVAPAFGDFDGDGRRDLLVGQERGRMRVFRNIGTEARPEFAGPLWFDEILPDGTIPTG